MVWNLAPQLNVSATASQYSAWFAGISTWAAKPGSPARDVRRLSHGFALGTLLEPAANLLHLPAHDFPIRRAQNARKRRSSVSEGRGYCQSGPPAPAVSVLPWIRALPIKNRRLKHQIILIAVTDEDQARLAGQLSSGSPGRLPADGPGLGGDRFLPDRPADTEAQRARASRSLPCRPAARACRTAFPIPPEPESNSWPRKSKLPDSLFHQAISAEDRGMERGWADRVGRRRCLVPAAHPRPFACREPDEFQTNARAKRSAHRSLAVVLDPPK